MLTKTDLQSMLQCQRKLWLEHYQPQCAVDEPAKQRRTTDGQTVGRYAREQLGKDFIWPRGGEDPVVAAAAAKAQLKASPQRAAAEVPMTFGGFYARADALVPASHGYILRETKAATFPLKKDKTTADTPDQHHIDDVAMQAWVMAQAGIPLAHAELNLLDNRWRYPGAGDYSGLFRQLDVTDAAMLRQAMMPEWLAQAQHVLQGAMPQITTGRHCSEPYSCPFLDYCKPLDPPAVEHPIELLPDAPGKKLAKTLRENKGYASLLEVPPEAFTGERAALYKRIQTAHRTGQGIREPASRDAIQALPYPRYYFDFEGIDLPVPRWPGVRPYEQIPFQWSCHIERSPGHIEHKDFIDLSGDDPSLPCLERMRTVIDPADGGPIIVYFAAYERSVLEALAQRHPRYAGLMSAYTSRLFDLLPVVKQHFYHPKMRGSFSIKKVLPAIYNDLDYENLPGVRDGTGAQMAYLQAVFDCAGDDDKKSKLRNQLLQYCEQDTWGMVEIAYFLAHEPRPQKP